MELLISVGLGMGLAWWGLRPVARWVVRYRAADDTIDRLIDNNRAAYRPGMEAPDEHARGRVAYADEAYVRLTKQRRARDEELLQVLRGGGKVIGIVVVLAGVSSAEERLPLGLQILRAAAPVAHAMDYTSTVQGLNRGLHEQAPMVGPIAYHPEWFALYKAGVALAADRAVVGLYRAEDQRRRWWALGMRPREWSWVLAGASVAAPSVASALNWRQ